MTRPVVVWDPRMLGYHHPGGHQAAAQSEPRRHRGNGSAAGPGRPTGSAGRHARRGSGADRSGGQFPLAGRRPACGVARPFRPESGGWVGHRPAKALSTMRQTADHQWSSRWSAGKVLQRRLPDGCASRTAPDSTGDRSSLTRSLHAERRWSVSLPSQSPRGVGECRPLSDPLVPLHADGFVTDCGRLEGGSRARRRR